MPLPPGTIDRVGSPLCIDATECFGLLRTTNEGHVALSVAALPTVVPVRFTLVGGELLFGIAAEPRLVAALDGNVVCLAASSVGPASRRAWTITVTGTARVLDVGDDPGAVPAVIESGPWGADRLVKLSADLVGGRYFGA